jgi:hypothetical protein
MRTRTGCCLFVHFTCLLHDEAVWTTLCDPKAWTLNTFTGLRLTRLEDTQLAAAWLARSRNIWAGMVILRTALGYYLFTTRDSGLGMDS